MNSFRLDINSEVHIRIDGLTNDQVVTIKNLIEFFVTNNKELVDTRKDEFSKSEDKELIGLSEDISISDGKKLSTIDNDNNYNSNSDELILGKSGRKYIFNYHKLEELYIIQDKNQSEIAMLAGVSLATVRNYLIESGLLDKKKN